MFQLLQLSIMDVPHFKVVILGDGGAGKTTWVQRLEGEKFSPIYLATTGVEVHPVKFNTNHGEFCIDFWDTAGQEKFGGLRDGYYIQSKAAITFMDCTSRHTVSNIPKWARNYIRVSRTPIFHVMNKMDVEDKQVNADLLHKLGEWDVEIGNMERNGFTPLIPMSVKSGFNLHAPIQPLLRILTGFEDLVLE